MTLTIFLTTGRCMLAALVKNNSYSCRRMQIPQKKNLLAWNVFFFSEKTLVLVHHATPGTKNANHSHGIHECNNTHFMCFKNAYIYHLKFGDCTILIHRIAWIPKMQFICHLCILQLKHINMWIRLNGIF